ncbi:MAG: D-glycero-beta-D-manno-heptose 1-phosphate adenylyltransferase [Bacteroidia bacterium]|jgi:rfaE bifunctional protein nucleotidyltransferase chain/domain|nr:D-glycero-beta-D-manno-heptose 1-phosphate adenylyltransferase [Bacteroidia bacterium]
MKAHPDFMSRKFMSRDALALLRQQLRFFGRKVVFTNGCFDLLHLGHVDYLAKAASFGDYLIVGLNSDASVKLLQKGPARPLQDEHSRSHVLAALHVVDAVVLFDEETPYELIKFIQPDVLVKGADYKVEEIAGHDIVLAGGGKVELVEFVPGYSTSAIERKIKGEL